MFYLLNNLFTEHLLYARCSAGPLGYNLNSRHGPCSPAAHKLVVIVKRPRLLPRAGATVPAPLQQTPQATPLLPPPQHSQDPPQLAGQRLLPAAQQDEALARDGVSREVPCSALKGETVPDSLPAHFTHPSPLLPESRQL